MTNFFKASIKGKILNAGCGMGDWSLENLHIRNGFKIEKYKWARSYFGIMPMNQMVLAKKVKDI